MFLKYRIITAITLIPIIIIVIFFLNFLLFYLVILFVCMLSAWEWGKLSGFYSFHKRIFISVLCGVFLSIILLTTSVYSPFIHIFQMQSTLWIALIWLPSSFVLLLYYPRSAYLWRNSKILRLVFGILTIVPFFCGMLIFRQNMSDNNQGDFLLFYVMLLVWGMDSGSYIFGRLIGCHKLAPKVSPNKTVEGFFCGVLTSAMITYLFYKYAPIKVDILKLLICSIITVLASVLGDLTESMFKREAGLKDSSNIIPGHGGILDRIDSLMAAIPVFSFISNVVSL